MDGATANNLAIAARDAEMELNRQKSNVQADVVMPKHDAITGHME